MRHQGSKTQPNSRTLKPVSWNNISLSSTLLHLNTYNLYIWFRLKTIHILTNLDLNHFEVRVWSSYTVAHEQIRFTIVPPTRPILLERRPKKVEVNLRHQNVGCTRVGNNRFRRYRKVFPSYRRPHKSHRPVVWVDQVVPAHCSVLLGVVHRVAAKDDLRLLLIFGGYSMDYA